MTHYNHSFFKSFIHESLTVKLDLSHLIVYPPKFKLDVQTRSLFLYSDYFIEFNALLLIFVFVGTIFFSK